MYLFIITRVSERLMVVKKKTKNKNIHSFVRLHNHATFLAILKLPPVPPPRLLLYFTLLCFTLLYVHVADIASGGLYFMFTNMVPGSSSIAFQLLEKFAIVAPSMILWSPAQLTAMIFSATTLPSESNLGSVWIFPTAPMAT